MAYYANRRWGCCEDDLEDELFIECTVCEGSYHFVCLQIAPIDPNSQRALNWKCIACRSQRPTPNEMKSQGKARDNITLRGSKRQALNSPPTTSPVTRDEVRDIFREEMKILLTEFNKSVHNIVNKELEPIRKEMSEFRDSMGFFNAQYEEMKKAHDEAEKARKELEEENSIMKETISDLSHRVNIMEQQSRSNNVEIQCVPENKQENLYTIVKQLGSVVGLELKEDDVMHVTRIAKRAADNKRPKSIVVQLVSPKIRDQLLASVRKYNKANPANKLNSADLGFAGDVTPVYIDEHLSPFYKDLQAATRQRAKRELHYRFTWVRGGKIFVRKDEEADVIYIKNKDTLKN